MPAGTGQVSVEKPLDGREVNQGADLPLVNNCVCKRFAKRTAEPTVNRHLKAMFRSPNVGGRQQPGDALLEHPLGLSVADLEPGRNSRRQFE